MIGTIALGREAFGHMASGLGSPLLMGKASLKLYLRQFEMVADYNEWDDEEKSMQLVTSLSLEGTALGTLDRVMGPMTYAGVKGALRVRFPDFDCASSYQNAFDTASR